MAHHPFRIRDEKAPKLDGPDVPNDMPLPAWAQRLGLTREQVNAYYDERAAAEERTHMAREYDNAELGRGPYREPDLPLGEVAELKHQLKQEDLREMHHGRPDDPGGDLPVVSTGSPGGGLPAKLRGG